MKESPEKFYLEIGERISKIRTAKGMSQAELAEKTQLSLPAISNIENGKSKTWLISFAKIAEALDVSADEILRIKTSTQSKEKAELQKLIAESTKEEQAFFLKLFKDIKKQR